MKIPHYIQKNSGNAKQMQRNQAPVESGANNCWSMTRLQDTQSADQKQDYKTFSSCQNRNSTKFWLGKLYQNSALEYGNKIRRNKITKSDKNHIGMHMLTT